MRLLEVVRGAKTSKQTLATAMAVAKRINKVGVVAGVCFGFIGNRMIEAYLEEVQAMLLEGATPAEIDGALEAWGLAMGPNAMMDLAGIDVGYLIRREHTFTEERHRLYRITDRISEMGRHGQKTGAGWYDYVPGKRDAIPNAEVVKMIEDHRASLGITPRKISDEEIVQRLVYSLVNEAAHILEEGIANKASDIDVVYIFGYGFPAHRGGPMIYADTVGLFNVVQSMKRFAKNPLDDAKFWEPAPLLARLVAEGKTFN